MNESFTFLDYSTNHLIAKQYSKLLQDIMEIRGREEEVHFL